MRTRHTPEQKAEAIQLATTLGKAEAARRTGISAGTIGSWLTRAGLANADPDGRADRIQVAQQTWVERRATLANRMGEVAADVLEQLATKYKGDELAAQRLASVLERLVTKAQLLVGDVTEISGVVTADVDVDVAQRRERALAVVRELSAAG